MAGASGPVPPDRVSALLSGDLSWRSRTDTLCQVDDGQLRRLLRRQAATVVVITAAGSERPVGFTATSFTSVSLRPPLVLFCVDCGSSSWPAVRAAAHVAVHLLGADQAELARTFATRGIDRFAPTAWHSGPYGVPLLDRALGWLVCRVAERVTAGDHAIVLAEPVVTAHAGGAPLLYHNGHYTRLWDARPPASAAYVPEHGRVAARPDRSHSRD
jgi:flavin reductase (DIM6/NTAB) family NADH-FMN oxidoreductase RutF